MSIPKGGVSDEQPLFLFGPSGKSFGPEFFQKLASAFWRINARNSGQRRNFDCFRRLFSFYFRIAIQNDVANIREKLRRAIAALGKAKKFRVLFEKTRGDFAAAEVRVIDDVFDKRNIRFDSANAKFAEGAVHALASVGQIRAPGRDFDQKRIVIRSERSAGVRSSPVEADAKSGRGAICRQLSIIWCEVFLR